MTSNVWDPTRVKAQLRLTTQRLGQLQDKKDSLAHITSKDIATLLRQRNVSLARAKVQNLMKDDAISNALEVLEMYCGVLLERFSDLERNDLRLHPSTVEAASSIIYAAPYVECRDLMIVRDLLIQRLGPDFARSAINNNDGHVSPRIVNTLRYVPSADESEAYLQKIARSFGVDWKPQMRHDEKVAALSEILDASDIMSTVDLKKLRLITSTGIPDSPPWLRPRVWKLLLGAIPLMKAQWDFEARKKRDSYYDLIRRLLTQFLKQPTPTSPLSDSDKSLLSLIDALSRVPAHLFAGLEDEPEQFEACPVHEIASEDVKIRFASALDVRLQLIEDAEDDDGADSSIGSTPEITLDASSAPNSPENGDFNKPSQPQRTLSLSSSHPKVFRGVAAHPFHVSALLRILFVHKSLNPGRHSPHIASLLIPLYAVLNQEVEPAELAHSEADAFWLFEALLREISELEDEDGGVVWMKKFSDRLLMADNELHEDLKIKGLDPGLPQYSYRWLSPILSHTLPFPAVLIVWDAILAQADVSRQNNPKLDHLLDICTAMLVRARTRLLLLGKPDRKAAGLWEEDVATISRSPLRSWELGEAFMEGMSLLQQYPLQQAGGIERIIQVAGDVQMQREELAKQPQGQTLSLGAKIRDTVWKGLTVQSASAETTPETSDEEEEEETENEVTITTPQPSGGSGSGWASRITSSVLRGITNQSAMEAPPSPISLSSSPSPSRDQSRAPSPAPSPHPPPVPEKDTSLLSPPPSASSLWSYAAKLKESDVAAAFSKASTNFSAKALDVWNARSAPARDAPSFDKQRDTTTAGTDVARVIAQQAREGYRRGSVPNIDRSDVYSPPPRPAFFKPPRDSRLFLPEEAAAFASPESPDSVTSAQSAPSPATHSRGQSFARLASLASLTGLQTASPVPTKSGPRPLLLNPTSLVTPVAANHVTRSANNTPTPGQWTDVLRNKVQAPRHKGSQSSISSSIASPKNARSGWDSDTSVSRVVPLKRISVSPAASALRATHSTRTQSVSSQSEFAFVPTARAASESSPRESLRSSENESRLSRGWERVAIPDSPSTLPSSPPPRTPEAGSTLMQTSVRVTNPERQRGSVVLSESGVSPLDPPPQIKRSLRKSASPTTLEPVEDTSDSSLPPVSPISPTTRVVPRIRSKRYGPQARLSTLRVRDSVLQPSAPEQSSLSPNTLTAPALDVDIDLATTPKAIYFPSTSPTDLRTPRRPQKLSTESNERRTRKTSTDTNTIRPRKVSTGSFHRHTESAADEGDDEGYDELLSAYESEEGSKDGHAWSSEA